jgi:hypothetical protein
VVRWEGPLDGESSALAIAYTATVLGATTKRGSATLVLSCIRGGVSSEISSRDVKRNGLSNENKNVTSVRTMATVVGDKTNTITSPSNETSSSSSIKFVTLANPAPGNRKLISSHLINLLQFGKGLDGLA